MKKLFPLFVAIPLLLSGCAQHYVMTLMSGNQITTAGKPKFQDGSYYYTDTQGRSGLISASRVREVSPESMSSKSTGFTPNPIK